MSYDVAEFPNEFTPEELMKMLPSDVETRKKGEKIGRNEKCPCGSGIKFKKCCLGTKMDNRGNVSPWLIAAEDELPVPPEPEETT